ncbi:MAG: hypothetical protein JXB15_12030 [Anaerolineales bacterium]|nr:hypothetical protein [Anaerolineales bacterium]
MMDFLLNPNIAYMLLAGGLVFAVLALLSPGTGVLEIGALFALLLAGWSVYNLPFNYWALALLVIGAVLFVSAIRRPKQVILLLVSILALVVGSAFLFRGETWWTPAVHPALAAVVSLLSASFFWLATRKTLEATLAQPSHDLSILIGAIGEARTRIDEEGSVQVGAELWSARSDRPITKGTQVRVVAREGFVLVVEAEE